MAETTTTTASESGSQDYSHLFRAEGIVSDVDVRVDVARSFRRLVAGDEDVEVDLEQTYTGAPAVVTRGARDRHAGEYVRRTEGEELVAMSQSYTETVHGPAHLMAKVSAEGMIGGAYVNTIAGIYLRLAAYVDFLVWGGWAEIDMVRAEMSLLMIRSHMGYAHAAVMRTVLAGRLVDDFFARTENFLILMDSGNAYTDLGSPGGGISNEA